LLCFPPTDAYKKGIRLRVGFATFTVPRRGISRNPVGRQGDFEGETTGEIFVGKA